MQVTFEVPDEFAKEFATDAESLSRVALECLALEGVRSDRLTTAQARRLLGIPSRYQMDSFLKEHGVVLRMTFEDVKRDVEASQPFIKRQE